MNDNNDSQLRKIVELLEKSEIVYGQTLPFESSDLEKK